MAQPAEIHVSDVLTFKRCRRLWDWTSLLRSNLTPRATYEPFFVGSAIHHALDQWYRYGIDHKESVPAYYAEYVAKVGEEAVKADQEKIAASLFLIEGVLDHYFEWTTADKTVYADKRLEWIANEAPFSAPIRTPKGRSSKRFYLRGRFDGIVRSLIDDRLYLVEFKTTRSVMERLKLLDHEEQALAYLNGVREVTGEDVAGIIYTIIRKRVPDTPKVLKNGFLSQDKNMVTTAERYVRNIRAQHGSEATNDFIRENYGSFIEHLLAQPNPFFARVVVRRTPEALQIAHNELYAVAQDMTTNPVIYRTGAPHCTWCLFREPCIAVDNGNIEYANQLLRDNYVQNTYHERREEDDLA